MLQSFDLGFRRSVLNWLLALIDGSCTVAPITTRFVFSRNSLLWNVCSKELNFALIYLMPCPNFLPLLGIFALVNTYSE